MKKFNKHLIEIITYTESTDLCSGGPRWANNVTILSYGCRPTAFQSLKHYL